MLLAFGWLATEPAHVMKALCALNVSASAFDLANAHLTPWIGTQLRALL